MHPRFETTFAFRVCYRLAVLTALPTSGKEENQFVNRVSSIFVTLRLCTAGKNVEKYTKSSSEKTLLQSELDTTDRDLAQSETKIVFENEERKNVREETSTQPERENAKKKIAQEKFSWMTISPNEHIRRRFSVAGVSGC